jgi:hypothetical protein
MGGTENSLFRERESVEVEGGMVEGRGTESVAGECIYPTLLGLGGLRRWHTGEEPLDGNACC